MLNNFKNIVLGWWEGELQEATIEEIFEHDDPPEIFKHHWSATIVRTIWFFWHKRWPILLPIIIGAAVALFIHFDSKL